MNPVFKLVSYLFKQILIFFGLSFKQPRHDKWEARRNNYFQGAGKKKDKKKSKKGMKKLLAGKQCVNSIYGMSIVNHNEAARLSFD